MIIPVSVHLLVCEIFIMTLSQHLSVFMPLQIISYPTQVPEFYLSIHEVTKHLRSVLHSLTFSVLNMYYI